MKTKYAVVLAFIGGAFLLSSTVKQPNMNQQATVVEVVVFDLNEGVNPEEAKEAIRSLNDFVSEQPGFVERRTGIATDGKWIDIVYWTDLASAERASEQLMKDPASQQVVGLMNSETMLFKHFELFNAHRP